jgi:hypothetical protein
MNGIWIEVAQIAQAQRVCSIALGIPTVWLGDGATSMLEFYTLLATIPRSSKMYILTSLTMFF